jgi:hypothetical protein
MVLVGDSTLSVENTFEQQAVGILRCIVAEPVHIADALSLENVWLLLKIRHRSCGRTT